MDTSSATTNANMDSHLVYEFRAAEAIPGDGSIINDGLVRALGDVLLMELKQILSRYGLATYSVSASNMIGQGVISGVGAAQFTITVVDDLASLPPGDHGTVDYFDRPKYQGGNWAPTDSPNLRTV